MNRIGNASLPNLFPQRGTGNTPALHGSGRGHPANRDLVAALAPLARHLRTRGLLEGARRGLLWALTGATALALIGRLLAQPDWPGAALAWGGLAVAIAMGVALVRRPDSWDVARAADRLGLAERVASALHADRLGASVAPLLLRDAMAALALVDRSAYPGLLEPRRWSIVGALVFGLGVALVAPLPHLGDTEGRRQAAEAVATSRRDVEALRAQVTTALPLDSLVARTVAELQTLEAELARTESPAAADQAIEAVQERLADLPDGMAYTERRAFGELATAWSERPDLATLSRALAARDPQAVDRAVEQLADRAAHMTPEERQSLQLALQAGANAAREAPGLAGALREAAARVTSQEVDGESVNEAISELGATLRQAAAQGAALATVQRAIMGLGQTRARLAQALANARSGGAGASGAGMGASARGSATGAGSGSSGVGSGASAGGAGSSGSTSGSSSSGQSGSGTGSGSGSGAGSGSGSGTGSGPGSGSGSGGGSGNSAAAGAGGGAGAGAGAGSGAAPGVPGAANAGRTSAGGNASPNTSGATIYEPVSVPSLMGGSGGPDVAVSGETAGASGEMVDVPDSPLTLGAVRPYDTVYGEYEAAARQSLARQPLPSGLQGLVQRYFAAIAPEGETSVGRDAPFPGPLPPRGEGTQTSPTRPEEEGGRMTPSSLDGHDGAAPLRPSE